MQKLGLLFLLLVVTKFASSQVLIAILFGNQLNTDKLEFGLFGGPTFTKFSNLEATSKAGFNLGLYFNIKISPNFFLHPEAIAKESLGAAGITPYPSGSTAIDEDFANGEVTRKIKAVSLPLLIHYRIAGLLFLEAGPQIDWQLQTKDIFKTKVNDNPLTWSTKVKGETTAFSVDGVGGLLYKFRKDKGIGLGARYCLGFIDVIKPVSGVQAHRAILLNISIPIGTGKSSQEKTPGK